MNNLKDTQLQEFAEEMDRLQKNKLNRISAEPENASQGLAKLVLTLVELLRRLLEEQAVRRMEGGSLTNEEIERLGQTFINLEEKMGELKRFFNLNDDDLNIDLGPLGNLM